MAKWIWYQMPVSSRVSYNSIRLKRENDHVDYGCITERCSREFVVYTSWGLPSVYTSLEVAIEEVEHRLRKSVWYSPGDTIVRLPQPPTLSKLLAENGYTMTIDRVVHTSGGLTVKQMQEVLAICTHYFEEYGDTATEEESAWWGASPTRRTSND